MAATRMRSLNFVLGMLLLLSPLALSQTIGSCHPYPGAVAKDCLNLIGENLDNDAMVSCGGGPETITLGGCSITTRCTKGPESIEQSDIVRRALTAIGACALNDRGSISGYYLTDDGVKTCYLYPGQ